MWETNDGSSRLLTRTRTPPARPFTKESKDKSGKPCLLRTAPSCEEQKKPEEHLKAKVLWSMTDAKYRGEEFL